MQLKPLIFLAFFAFGIMNEAGAQCRSFVKNTCGSLMDDYIPGENFNAAKFRPGDEAELAMTFYKNEAYRILVCSHAVLGDVEFQVMDDEANVLFDNREKEFTDTFDFSVAGTQELTIKVKVAEDNPNPINPEGCVAILIGRKIEQ